VPRHDLDALSLVAGVLFAGVGLASLLADGVGLAARWTLPVLLILAGVVGLLASGGAAHPPRGPDEPERP
jgi:fatty acid desaturase